MTSLDQAEGSKVAEGTGPFFIGLTGPAGCGKDTVAEKLDACLNFVSSQSGSCKKIRVMSLADPLKAVCNIALGLETSDMYTQEGKKRLATLYPHMTHREILQKVGTECFRATFGPDVWVTALKYHAIRNGVDIVIVPDVRFDNEAAMVKENGVLISIIPGFPGYQKIEQSDHSSEKGVTLPPELIVMNDSTREQMFGIVTKYILGLNLV
jgi:hypothetical protein